jgi:hypothetical protein
MTKKTTNIQNFFQNARKRLYNDTKNMTVEEKHDYIVKGAEIGKKRVSDEMERIKREQEQKNGKRNFSVLVRLNKDERTKLETDADGEKITLSSLIRRRALGEKNTYENLMKHILHIESQLLTMKKTQKKNSKN